MKQIVSLLFLSALLSCGKKSEIEDRDKSTKTDTTARKGKPEMVLQKKTNEAEANRIVSLKNEFKSFVLNTINDTIKADLNGDKILDFAFFSNQHSKRELFVIDGKSHQKIKIGEDKSFGTMADDFGWVDFWGTTDDRETFEVLVVDSEIVGDTITPLSNKSIFVRKDEVGGGVITYKDHKFIWIHQSD